MCDYTLYAALIPALGILIIGLMAGFVGTFAFLKKQTMLGDTIAHAALPGICGAFLFTNNGSSMVLIFGGFIAGLCAVALVTILQHYTHIGSDAILGTILSVFFGLGLVLLTHIQKLPIAAQAVLNKFLFGSAATLLYEDLLLLTIVGCIVCVTLFCIWHPLVIVLFDQRYAHTIGMPVWVILTLFYILLVLVIVAGLYAVGVVLMSSLLVAPAVAARALTRSVQHMAFCAAAWGACAGMLGMLWSLSAAHLPTGPAIVIVATGGTLLVLAAGLARRSVA